MVTLGNTDNGNSGQNMLTAEGMQEVIAGLLDTTHFQKNLDAGEAGPEAWRIASFLEGARAEQKGR